MRYLVNAPRGKGRTRAKTGRTRRSPAQRAATARMRAALAAKKAGKAQRSASRKRKRTITREVTVARKKRTRSTRKGPKRTAAWRKRAPKNRRYQYQSQRVHRVNPRRRAHSRRRYHRNPGIVAMGKQMVMDSVLTLAGGAVTRTASNLIPITLTGYAAVAKDLAVAMAVRMLSQRFLGAERARMIGAGAMQVPMKNLITALMPSAAPYLGSYDSLGAYALPNAGMGDYMPGNGGFAGQMYGSGMNELGEYVEAY